MRRRTTLAVPTLILGLAVVESVVGQRVVVDAGEGRGAAAEDRVHAIFQPSTTPAVGMGASPHGGNKPDPSMPMPPRVPSLPVPGFPEWRFRALLSALNHSAIKKNSSLDDVYCCTESLSNSLIDLFMKGSGAAFQLFDSWGVFPGDPGSFVECYNAPGDTKYCSVAVQTDENYVTPGMGICVPSECNEATMTALRAVLLTNPGQGEVTQVKCYSSLEWSNNLTVVLAICGVLAFLILFATAVDGFMVIGLFAADDDKVREREALSPLLTTINGGESDDDVFFSDDAEVPRRSSRPLAPSRRRDSMYTRKIWMRYPDGRTAGLCWLAIDVFSLPRSLMALFAAPAYGPEMRVFDGLKVLTMLWIMSGQTMSLLWPLITNKASIYIMGGWDQPWAQLVLQSSLATDTFLFISGFLAMHRTLDVFSRRVVPKSILSCILLTLKLVFRRVLRLAPLLAASMAAYLWVLPALMDGPYWNNFFVQPDYAECTDSWWRILTFSNNFGMPDSNLSVGCMSWTWYLALDMQLSILTPICAIMFWRWGFVAVLVNFVLMCATAGTAAWIIHYEGIVACGSTLTANVYPHIGLLVKPYTRAVPYLLGIVLAYWVNAMGGENGITNISKPSLLRRLAVGSIAAALLLASLFGGIDMQYDNDQGEGLVFGANGVTGRCKWDRETGQVYLALYRISWSLGLFILGLICLAGWGGWVTSILSMQSWTTYSRLVYGAYLVHPILCQAFAYGAQRALLYSDFNFLNWYASTATLSFACSLVSYVLLEGPLIRIVKGYVPR